MKGMLQGLFSLLALLVVILGITWIAQGSDFFLYKTFAPKYEKARREAFEQSKSYNQGMIQELQNMEFQYAEAAPAHKKALASVILRRYADFDLSRLPAPDRRFVEDLREAQLHEVTP